MKKVLIASLILLGNHFAKAQLFVDGTVLDSIHSGFYLTVEERSEVGDRVFILIESDKRVDKKRFFQQDWLTDRAGKRKPFETRTAALNHLYENGWMVEVVLSSDSLKDNRLLLRRVK